MSVGIPSGNIKALGVMTITVDLPSVAANTTGVVSVTVPGIELGDFIGVNKPSHETGLGIVNARVSADDTIEITAMNTTAGAIDEVSETFTLVWMRPETITSALTM